MVSTSKKVTKSRGAKPIIPRVLLLRRGELIVADFEPDFENHES